MTKEEKARYDEPEQLAEIIKRVLAGLKIRLQPGHSSKKPERRGRYGRFI
jgi:hypothetical protein